MEFLLLSYKKIIRDLTFVFFATTLGLTLLYFYGENNFQMLDCKVPKVLGGVKKPLQLTHLYPENESKMPIEPVDFSKELVLLTSPQKPGEEGKERLYITHVRGWMKEEIFLDQWFYLKKTAKAYFSSKEKTPLGFKVVENEKGLFIQQKIECEELSQNYQPKIAKGFYPEIKPFEEKDMPPLFSELFKSSYIGKDLLKKGANYQLLIGDVPYFVQKGDLFAFIDGNWIKLEFNKESSHPLFRIGETDENKLFVEGWDSEGNYYSKSFQAAKSKEPGKKAKNWISQIKKRTKTKVSMSILGQRMILKKGDWLVEKSKRWSALRTDLQKEKFLKQKGESEVFVFEKIEENKGDKKLMGFLYNTTRTQKVSMTFSFKNTTNSVTPAPPLRKSRFIPRDKDGIPRDQGYNRRGEG